jgi:DNA-binding PadR family transcriptional regulator
MSQSEGIHVKTIYKSLKLLERKGLVISRPAGDGRVLYEITAPGRELAQMLTKTDLIELVESGGRALPLSA